MCVALFKGCHLNHIKTLLSVIEEEKVKWSNTLKLPDLIAESSGVFV